MHSGWKSPIRWFPAICVSTVKESDLVFSASYNRTFDCLLGSVTKIAVLLLMSLSVTSFSSGASYGSGVSYSSPGWGQRVRSITVPDLRGTLVNLPVVSSPAMNNIAKADLADGVILVNWERFLALRPSAQTIQLVLAHEAGHLLQQDTSINREKRADYFAGRAMRMEGYTSRDMEIVRADMLRILGHGDATHPPAAERVEITMRGYNSIATRPQTTTSGGVSSGGSSGGWRHFGQGLR
jgi:hypothetical protein